MCLINGAKVPQSAASCTSTCTETEVYDHPATLGVTCGQHVESPTVVGYLEWNYRYYSIPDSFFSSVIFLRRALVNAALNLRVP